MNNMAVLKLIYKRLSAAAGSPDNVVQSADFDEDGEIILTTIEDGRKQSWALRAEHIRELFSDALVLNNIKTQSPAFWAKVFNDAAADNGSPLKVGKIGLIKAFRANTGDGLKESKDAIDKACADGIFIAARKSGPENSWTGDYFDMSRTLTPKSNAPEFKPTHTVRHGYKDHEIGRLEEIEVMLVKGDDGGGPAYTREEWETTTGADYEQTTAGDWKFQGQPFKGIVRKIK